MKHCLTKPQTAAGCGNANVPAIVNTTLPLSRKPRNLFFRESLIYLFFIVTIVFLSGCPGPQGPRGVQGDKGDQGDSATLPTLRECHTTLGYPTACYNASTGVLTFTGIDLVDVDASGTADDVDTSKLSIAGKGGNDDAISLTTTPTIAKVNTGEFSLTVDMADRTNMLKILDIGGHSASDRSLYSIVLEQNWNGLSSPALSVPVRNTNIPPGYCGTLPSDPAARPTIDGTANDFFAGTGTENDPYSITMRLYCDDLRFDWNNNYSGVASDHKIYYSISFTTGGTYQASLIPIVFPVEEASHNFVSDDLGSRSVLPADDKGIAKLWSLSTSIDTTTLTSTSVVEVYQEHTTGTTFGGSQGFRFCRMDLLSCE